MPMHGWEKRTCLRLLRETFGAEDFRPGQREAVTALLRGRDLLALFPTGAGKSLCYQLPALMLEGPTLVLSPLIALMRDQVEHLRARGVPAVCLHSLQTPEERAETVREIRAGRVRLIYAAPERLEVRSFAALMAEIGPGLIVVDEAHCAVQWGESFRPAYAGIGAFADSLPARPPVCAMTATADRRTRAGIRETLHLRRDYVTVRLPMIRGNLRYSVVTTRDARAEAERLALDHEGEKGIVFCRTREQTAALTAFLRRRGIAAAAYHAGLDRAERERVQTAFAAGEIPVLAATSAFGMGVDIPDIRWVAHVSPPASVQDLAQQSGRAGRDGEPADCVLLVDPCELARIGRRFRAERTGLLEHPFWSAARRRGRRAVRREAAGLRQVLRLCLDGGCLPQGIAAAFGEKIPACGVCSACLRRQAVGGRTPLAPVPEPDSRSPEGVRLWALRWQRDAVAASLRIPPAEAAPDEALAEAARSGVLDPGACDPRAYQALQGLSERLFRA